MKILFTTNVPSPYRVDFFNELGKLCDLTVLFEKHTSTERDRSWSNYKFNNFKGVFLKGLSIGVDKAWCRGYKKFLKDKSYDAIVCCNYSSPTGMAMISYMRRHKIKYFMEGDGGFAKTGKGLKEKIKKYFIKGACGYFSTAKIHDEYYLTYGADKNKLHRYPFTSLFEKDILPKLPTKEEKKYLREELGIKSKKVLLAIGQFIPRKGFDVLLRTMKNLSKDIGVYFVGGEATAEYINLKQEFELKNVNFVGFKNKEELKKYYMVADLFVLPTREDIWGLVINEAMANGLPIISTDRCVAALELVKDGENGYVVPVNDVDALTIAIKKVLEDDEVCLKMGNESLKKIREYTFENMAKRHMEVFKAFKEE